VVTWRGHSCLPGCPLGRALMPTLPSTLCHHRAQVSRRVSTRQAECLRRKFSATLRDVSCS
jgi:hypothetical protein